MGMNVEEGSKKEVQLVVFSIGDEEFGVEINQVREIVKLIPITHMPKAPDFIEGVINLRGQITMVIDLAKRLSIPSKGKSETTRIIVVEVGDVTVGMVVDSVTEVLRLATDKIETTPSILQTEVHEKYLKQVGKLKDRLLILLDLSAVLSMEEVQHIEQHVRNIDTKKEKEGD
ncbi:MAG: chemotaxis protein CheW [Candidatus Omnitrophota bacterium]